MDEDRARAIVKMVSLEVGPTIRRALAALGVKGDFELSIVARSYGQAARLQDVRILTEYDSGEDGPEIREEDHVDGLLIGMLAKDSEYDGGVKY